MSGLSFITFPAIVSQMPGGAIFGILFFGSLTMAGFTSLISVLQVVSAAVQEKFGLTPRSAAVGVGVVSAVLSVLLFSTTTGLLALDVADQWANNIGIVASAVLATILVIWVLRRGPELRYHLNAVSTFQVGRLWVLLVGVLAPVILGLDADPAHHRAGGRGLRGHAGLVPRRRRLGHDRVHHRGGDRAADVPLASLTR